MPYLSEPGEHEQLNQALRDLEVQVDSKCSSTVFWSSATVVTGVLIVLLGFLFTRQNNLAESVASIHASFASMQKVSDTQATILEKISDSQVGMATSIAVTASVVERTSKDICDLVTKLNGTEMLSGDVVARIAREQIAWAKERAIKK